MLFIVTLAICLSTVRTAFSKAWLKLYLKLTNVVPSINLQAVQTENTSPKPFAYSQIVLNSLGAFDHYCGLFHVLL